MKMYVKADSANLYLNNPRKSYRIDLADPSSVYELFDDIADRDVANQFARILEDYNSQYTEVYDDLNEFYADAENFKFALKDILRQAKQESVEEALENLEDLIRDYDDSVLGWIRELKSILK